MLSFGEGAPGDQHCAVPPGVPEPVVRPWWEYPRGTMRRTIESMTTKTREQGTAEPLPAGVSRARLRELVANSNLPALDLARLRDDIDGPLRRRRWLRRRA